MKPEVTPKQRWLIRAWLVLPFFVSSSYHLIKLYNRAGMMAFPLFPVAVILCAVTILVVERKYEYRLPSGADYGSFGFAFCLIAAVNFGVTYGFHTNNRLEEAVDSVFTILPVLPFMLFVKAKTLNQRSNLVEKS